jgi:hypothetical protein
MDTSSIQMNTHTRSRGIRGLTAPITLALAVLALSMGLPETYAQSTTFTTSATIDSVQLNRDRTVTVTYTVFCSEPAIASPTVLVEQDAGRFGKKFVFGFEDTGGVACDPAGTQFTETISPQEGSFRAGRATVSILGEACVDFENCSRFDTEQVVRLRH